MTDPTRNPSPDPAPTTWDRAIPRLIPIRYEYIPAPPHQHTPTFYLSMSLVGRVFTVTTYFGYPLN